MHNMTTDAYLSSVGGYCTMQTTTTITASQSEYDKVMEEIALARGWVWEREGQTFTKPYTQNGENRR